MKPPDYMNMASTICGTRVTCSIPHHSPWLPMSVSLPLLLLSVPLPPPPPPLPLKDIWLKDIEMNYIRDGMDSLREIKSRTTFRVSFHHIPTLKLLTDLGLLRCVEHRSSKTLRRRILLWAVSHYTTFPSPPFLPRLAKKSPINWTINPLTRGVPHVGLRRWLNSPGRSGMAHHAPRLQTAGGEVKPLPDQLVGKLSPCACGRGLTLLHKHRRQGLAKDALWGRQSLTWRGPAFVRVLVFVCL